MTTLQFFDTHIRADCLDETALHNLTYFNVKHVLVAAHAPRPFETSEDLLTYFSDLVSDEYVRLQRAGLAPVVALGVHPRAQPRRVHYEIWRELPVQLADPAVVAIGELALETGDAREEALLTRQLAMARDLEMPALVTASTRERARKVRRILEIVRSVGIVPALVLINHIDFTCLRPVIDAGCWAGITVGPTHLTTQEAVALLSRYRDYAHERVVLNSGLRPGLDDVLALPKVAVALLENAYTVSEVRSLVWGNACRLFL